MSYEKQTWQTGDTITAEKLNHIEDGIGENMTVINATVSNVDGKAAIILDKTYNEIVAISNTIIIRYSDLSDSHEEYEDTLVYGRRMGFNPDNSKYLIQLYTGGNRVRGLYECLSENDYPYQKLGN